LADANAAILAGFYASLKELEPRLRFVMVTGVTRYSMMGLSSGLNHLKDISFNDKFATIRGFTPEEMDQFYGHRYGLTLDIMKANNCVSPTSSEANLRQKILDYFDGYSWDGLTRVLNP
jgi:hypothetical protein